MVSNICCSGDSILLLVFFFFFATKLQGNQKGWIFFYLFQCEVLQPQWRFFSIFRLFRGLCEESNHRVWSCVSEPTALILVLVSTHCPAGTTLWTVCDFRFLHITSQTNPVVAWVMWLEQLWFQCFACATCTVQLPPTVLALSSPGSNWANFTTT